MTIDNDNLDPIQFLRRSPHPVTFFMTSTVESDVREVILALKNSSALDYYRLNSYMIKASLESLVDPLTCLCNKCLEEGNRPDPVKMSKITLRTPRSTLCFQIVNFVSGKRDQLLRPC